MTNEGRLIVISGFSGVGKGAVIKELQKISSQYVVSVSVTTRDPRKDEIDGVHYYFITEEEFARLEANHDLVESAEYCRHHYGTPRRFIEESMAEGKRVLLEIEIQGAMKIKKKYPDALLLYIMPPSARDLFARLKKRDSESAEVIRERIEKAAHEAEDIEKYDYIVVNDLQDKCAGRVHQLITRMGEKGEEETSPLCCRPQDNLAFITDIRTQIQDLLKGDRTL